MVAPLEPIEIIASAIPVFTKLVATNIEDLGFCLKANAGDSSSLIIPCDGTIVIGKLST